MKDFLKIFKSLNYRIGIYFIVLGVLLMLGIHFSLGYVFDKYHEISGEKSVENARTLFENIDEGNRQQLLSNIMIINNSERIKRYKQNRERDSLYNACKDIFRYMSQNQGISQLNFLDTQEDHTSFLRMQNKKHFGDVVHRNTYMKALKTNAAALGYELQDTKIYLSVISPMYLKYKLLGFVEMAKSLDGVIQKIKGGENEEYGIYIYKKFTTEREWTSQKALFGERNNWNDFEDILLVSSTNKRLMPIENITMGYGKYENSLYESIQLGDKTYNRGSFPIYDVHNKHIGNVFVMSDITASCQRLNSSKQVIMFVVFILFLVIFIMVMRRIDGMVQALRHINTILKKISKGVLEKNTIKYRNGEIGEIQRTMNILSMNYNRISEYAVQIDKGNLDLEFIPLSKDDRIGNSLLKMQKSLKEAKNEGEKRFLADQEQQWIQNGFTKFNDMLRQPYADLSELGYAVIKEMIDYLDAILAGIFIYNEERSDNKKLELIASYAYDRRKNIKKAIEMGEGLVGACAMERKMSIFNELPSDYIEISSGLGNSEPGYLIVIPLIVEDKLLGVIELASVNEMSEVKINFLKQIVEIIATSMSTTKMNQRTKMLVDRLQRQSEMQAMNEEELRQNLEELQATQESSQDIEEKANRQQKQLKKEVERLNMIIEAYKMQEE